MSKITSIFWHILSRFKYHLVIIAGLAIVGFIDDESVLKRIEYEYQIEDLQKEIAKYKHRYEMDSKRLKELNRNPDAIAKIARERYFMKADDEDIFVLSDDKKTISTGKPYETTE